MARGEYHHLAPKEVVLAAHAEGELRSIVANPEWNAVLAEFGYQAPNTNALRENVTAQRDFAAAGFDVRLGEERANVDIRQRPLTARQEELTLTAAEKFGMIRETKPRDPFTDHQQEPQPGEKRIKLALGAGGRHIFYRVAHAGPDSDLVVATGDTTFDTKAIRNYRAKEVRVGKLSPEELDAADRLNAYEESLLNQVNSPEGKLPEIAFARAAVQATQGERQADGTYTLSPDRYAVTEDVIDGDTIVRYVPHDANDRTITIIKPFNREPDTRSRTGTDDFVPALLAGFARTGTTPDGIDMSTTGLFGPFQHLLVRRHLLGTKIDIRTGGFATGKTTFDKPGWYLHQMNEMMREAVKLSDALANQR
jgi:hypothetical protein